MNECYVTDEYDSEYLSAYGGFPLNLKNVEYIEQDNEAI